MFSRNVKHPQHGKTKRAYSSDDSLSETERQAIHIELEEMTLHPQGRAGAVGRVQPCRGAKRKAQESIDNAYLREKIWRDTQEVLRISKRRKRTELTERGLSTSGLWKGREIVASQSKLDVGHSSEKLIYANIRRGGMNLGKGEGESRQAEGVEGDSETDLEDCGEVLSQESRLCDESVQDTEEGLQGEGEGEGEGEISASDDNDDSEDRLELPASYDLTENVSVDVDDPLSTSQDEPSCTDIQDESDDCEEREGHGIDQDEILNGDGSNPRHEESNSSNLSDLPENQTEEESSESQDSGWPDVSQSQILTGGMLLPIEDPTVKGEDQVRDRCVFCLNNLETIRRDSIQSALDPILVIWTCDQCQTDCTFTWVTSNCPKRGRRLKRNRKCPICRYRWSSFDILEQARTYNPVLYHLSY
ncbi:uncharacterized protein L199_000249 [Kwoniella botswanensis]|uniref:uncharacterized protein n=1 Tax=Kwoniella botswanensis TaxID=1268659 RepID=UPI00315CB851